jgi:hypothetical protein
VENLIDPVKDFSGSLKNISNSIENSSVSLEINKVLVERLGVAVTSLNKVPPPRRICTPAEYGSGFAIPVRKPTKNPPTYRHSLNLPLRF